MKRLRVSNINPSSPSPTPPPTTTTSTGRRKTKIFVLTPSGEHLPPGEAVKRGLVKRSSCERCRNRKLKCSGPGESGNELCQRCNQDGLECIFSTRATIGRPPKNSPEEAKGGKKRRVTKTPDSSSSDLPSGSTMASSSRLPNLTSAEIIGHQSQVVSYPNAFQYSQAPSNDQSLPQSFSTASESPQFPLDSSWRSLASTSTLSNSNPLTQPLPWTQNHPRIRSNSASFQSQLQSQLVPLGSESHNNGLHQQFANGKMLPQPSTLPSPSATPSSVAEQWFFQSFHASNSGSTSNADSFSNLNQNINSQNQPMSPSSSTAAASLSDLSLAAYLETLDTLELNPADGLTESMMNSPGGSIMLTEGLSYAVPSDFSWWDLNLVDSALSNTQDSNSTLPSTPFLNGADSGSNRNTQSNRVQSGVGAAFGEKERSWPRGQENGMGQGEITLAEGVVIKGSGWKGDGFGGNESSTSVKGKEKGTENKRSSCCSSKEQSGPAAKESCCSSQKKVEIKETPDCCSSKAQLEEMKERERSNSDHRQDATSSSSSLFPPVNTFRASSPTRVHCIPNPTGSGCLCQHDGSVALLSIQKSLKESARHQELESDSTSSQKSKSLAEARTLHLTLCTSQAVASSCACSADCEVCRNDPSTGTSASILVATSLQIYARAVHILREGFGRSNTTTSSNPTGNGGSGINLSSVIGATSLDVRIGEYRPGSVNARQIALFAMKLELRDLRSALGRVAEMAKSRRREDDKKDGSVENSSSKTNLMEVGGVDADNLKGKQRLEGEKKGGNEKGGNASSTSNLHQIDELVITKLYSQLGDLLQTIEGLQ